MLRIWQNEQHAPELLPWPGQMRYLMKAQFGKSNALPDYGEENYPRT